MRLLSLTLVALAVHGAGGPLAGQSSACESAEILQPSSSLAERDLCELADEAAATMTDALYVSQHGAPVLSWHRADMPTEIHVMSITKSVAALAFGRLLLDGRLESLEVPVSRFLPEWRQGRKEEITIWHVLTHTTGMQDMRSAGVEIEPAPDAVQLAIAAELEADPGERFEYSNKAVNVLSRVVEEIARRPIDEYLGSTVFRDLGISDFEWIRDPSGNPYVMAGLTIGAGDLARVGELMLRGGMWDGRRIVDEAFAASATSPQHDLFPRHGLLWWLLEGEAGDFEGFYGDGWLGQWIVVVPETGVVGVRLVSRDSWSEPAHGFSNFRELVYALGR